LKRIIKGYLFLFLIAGAIIAFDQLTKSLVREQLNFGETWMPLTWLAPYARIVHWQNTGAAFGMSQGYNLVFSALAVMVALAIVYFYPKVPYEEFTLRFAMSLQLGGALGNVVDRLTIGEVTDFISVGSFPVFNIADASITIGVIVLLLGMWLNDRKKPASVAPPVEVLPEVPESSIVKDGPGE
jgi:signal peptidase II